MALAGHNSTGPNIQCDDDRAYCGIDGGRHAGGGRTGHAPGSGAGSRTGAASGGGGRRRRHGAPPRAHAARGDRRHGFALVRGRATLAGRVHHLAEQESTDFDKCLRNIRAPFVLALGVAGARIDHGLAVMNGLVQRPMSPVCSSAPRMWSFTRRPSFGCGCAKASGSRSFRWRPFGARAGACAGPSTRSPSRPAGGSAPRTSSPRPRCGWPSTGRGCW